MADNMLLERMFANRGYTHEFIANIESHSTQPMQDLDLLCYRLKDIHDRGLVLALVTDFDMDGIMCAAEGFAGLAELGFRVSLYRPDPTRGYGFDQKDVGMLLNQIPETSAILTADVGITAFKGVKAAKACGIQFFITDHHVPDAQLPDADVIVNPHRPGERLEFPHICGAYVLYHVLQRYADLFCDRYMQEQMRRLRVFAGIGTVSDGMPLLHENRQLVRDAISISRLVYASHSDFVVNHIMGCDIYRRAFRGLYAMLSMFASMGKIEKPQDIDEDFFGFYLAPAFNSVKRIGTDFRQAADVFFGPDSYAAASALYALNGERKRLVAQYMDELSGHDQPYAPYIYVSDAPGGILGLMAQQLMSQTGEPVVCVRIDDTIHGSGRSPFWYPFLDKTRAMSMHAGGHNPAFGVGFANEREIKMLRAYLTADVADVKSKLDPKLFVRRPDFVISHDGTGDTVIDIVLFLEYLEEIRHMAPFGSGFEKPDILLKFRVEDGEWRIMGSLKQHLKITLSHGFEVLLWNQAYCFPHPNLDKDGYCNVWGHLDTGEFRGVQTVQFVGTLV